MDKLLWMRCFVRAVETGSFSAVARELGIGQPNVSRHVAALEKSLGTRLLHRSTRQMVATAEGQRYYAQARQVLDIIGEAEAEVHGEQDPHGLLRIACPESIGTELLIPALPDFLQRYPHVDFVLVTRTSTWWPKASISPYGVASYVTAPCVRGASVNLRASAWQAGRI
jgi:LysR family transcriptional regulator for bpeEF and oprC